MILIRYRHGVAGSLVSSALVARGEFDRAVVEQDVFLLLATAAQATPLTILVFEDPCILRSAIPPIIRIYVNASCFFLLSIYGPDYINPHADLPSLLLSNNYLLVDISC